MKSSRTCGWAGTRASCPTIWTGATWRRSRTRAGRGIRSDRTRLRGGTFAADALYSALYPARQEPPMSAWIRRATLCALALALAFPALAEQPVRVFAAASLTNALNDIATEWEKAGHAKPSLAFAASSALAKQIEAGAPADVFASADVTWMDYLDQRGKLQPGTRADIVGNSLVLIVPQ